MSVGGAAFWLTKTFSLLPPHQGRVWLGGKNCRRAVFLELQQAIVQDISLFFFTSLFDERQKKLHCIQSPGPGSCCCFPPPPPCPKCAYMALQPLGTAGVTKWKQKHGGTETISAALLLLVRAFLSISSPLLLQGDHSRRVDYQCK